MRPEIERIFQRITDVFSGADGGVQFVLLKELVERMDQQAQVGDETAEQVLTVTLRRFNNLLDVAAKPLQSHDKNP